MSNGSYTVPKLDCEEYMKMLEVVKEWLDEEC